MKIPQTPRILVALAILATGAATADGLSDFDAQGIADAYSAAVNSRDLDAVLSFWSEDAQLVFLPGGADRTISGHSELREFYERVFSSDHAATMTIVVMGVEATADLVREWGSYKIGQDVSGCYVVLRRKIDEWKIHREWLFEPCSALVAEQGVEFESLLVNRLP